MSRIILHVGHGKTGTSALQSSFALSVAALAQAGIHYPDHPELALAAEGQITSGNIVAKHLVKAAKEALSATDGDVLFSNEMLFHDVVVDEGLLVSLMDLGVPVTVVLYIRNPLPHAISLYGQLVKRNGFAGELGDFLPTYGMTGAVTRFIKHAKSAGVDLKILNYSNHSEDILGSFATAIGLAPDVLIPPAVGRINRSLTQAETYMQRGFNSAWGKKSSQFISDPLCNLLPDIPSELPALRPRDYKQFARRLAKITAKVNVDVPPQEQYVIEPYVASDYGRLRLNNLRFSKDQIDVLVQAISSRIVDESQNNALRNFVISAQKGDTISQSDIEMFTALALKLRPDDANLLAKKDALSRGATFKPSRKFLIRERVKQMFRSQ